MRNSFVTFIIETKHCHFLFGFGMVTPTVLRGSPPLQRWLLLLVMLSLVMCGCVLISFSVRMPYQRTIRQRSLRGDDIQMFHLSVRDNVARRVSIASTEVWGRRAQLILAEIREKEEGKNTLSVDTPRLTLLEPVKLLPVGDTKKRALKCVGWRNTAGGTPNGPREPEKDMNCTELVPNNASGYCEVADTKTGEHFQVMRKASNILRNRVPFRCANAPAFARFRVEAHAEMENSMPLLNVANQDHPPRDGIVMVVYPQLIPSAYATIRALRDVLGCSLPVEIWYRPDEMKDLQMLNPLRNLSQSSSISFHSITDPVAKRFVAKIYAIRNSFFDRVLFLDADNVPVRDPSFLFNSPEFLETGALFWPDFWHPDSTIFGLHSRSLLWELLDMPFVDMFEQESGQLLVDRRLHAAPLDLAFFYATHNPNFLVHYKLVWGDKDLFRLAWLKLNATFYMVDTPPAMAGMVIESSAFCGMTMVQHDPNGEVLFLHRNKHKLSGRSDTNRSEATALSPIDDAYPDPAIWTHLLSFDGNFSRDQYAVQAFTTPLNFTTKQKCFGRRSLRHSPQFHVQTFADLSFAQFETDLRLFAKEAIELY